MRAVSSFIKTSQSFCPGTSYILCFPVMMSVWRFKTISISFSPDLWWTPHCSSFHIQVSVNTCLPWTGCESALTLCNFFNVLTRTNVVFYCFSAMFRKKITFSSVSFCLRDLEGNQIQTISSSILKTCSKLEVL